MSIDNGAASSLIAVSEPVFVEIVQRSGDDFYRMGPL
jgi:hypothetical protein